MEINFVQLCRKTHRTIYFGGMDVSKLYSFLKKLKKNNTKEWFDKNRDEYQQLRKSFEGFIGDLIKHASSIEPSLEGLDPKKCMFRINRDIRFTNDKTPYKTNFAAVLNKEGKKSPKASYYIHIEPGNSFIAGGVYMPESNILSLIREGIDYEGDKLQKIISSKNFVKLFGGMEEAKVKTTPKGYDAKHPSIELLKYKSFIAVHNISDAEASSCDLVKYSAKIFKEIKPLNDFLNKAIEYEQE